MTFVTDPRRPLILSVGQIWQSRDPRRPRQLEIVNVYERFAIVRNTATGRRSSIYKDSFCGSGNRGLDYVKTLEPERRFAVLQSKQ